MFRVRIGARLQIVAAPGAQAARNRPKGMLDSGRVHAM